MARVAMAHVPDPPKLVSLEYKKIHHWLKKYHEYEVLGGTGLMNKFIDKAQLLMLMVKAKRDITSLEAKETFSNVEIEFLLRSHNETLSLDQSVRRLKEDVEFSLKGKRPTSEELSKFYDDFGDAVLSLGTVFRPDNKVIKEIFISKMKPEEFQKIVKNETMTKEIFPNYTTVFIKAYNILEDAKNTSATIGWYNQLVAPVASKAKDNIVNTNQNKRLFSTVHQEKSSSVVINPKASGSGDRSKSNFPRKDYSLPGDRYNPALNDTCFRCWEKHLKSETFHCLDQLVFL